MPTGQRVIGTIVLSSVRSAQIKNLREKMCCSLARVYITTKIFPADNFQASMEPIWCGCQHINVFGSGGVLRRSSCLGNLKPLVEKLRLRRTITWGFLFFNVMHLCPPHQPLPQTTLSWVNLWTDWFTSSPWFKPALIKHCPLYVGRSWYLNGSNQDMVNHWGLNKESSHLWWLMFESILTIKIIQPLIKGNDHYY